MRARYSRQKGYTISNRRAPRQTIRATPQRLKIGPAAAKYVGLAVLAVLAVLMLTQSTTNSTSAYEQNSLRKDIGQVDQDTERLRLEAKRAQSLQEIVKSPVIGEMQPMQNAQYIEKGTVAGVSTAAPTPH